MADAKKMTKGERDSLLSLTKQREKVLKTMASQRAAEMLAEFERQISAIYPFAKDETWKAAMAEGERAINEANAKVKARCEELGIPEQFQPSLNIYWASRGENVFKDRCTELRRVAKAEIEAFEKAARSHIEQMSVQAQTEIISSGLESPAAMEFLQNTVAIEKLMPAIDAKRIDAGLSSQKRTYN